MIYSEVSKSQGFQFISDRPLIEQRCCIGNIVSEPLPSVSEVNEVQDESVVASLGNIDDFEGPQLDLDYFTLKEEL